MNEFIDLCRVSSADEFLADSAKHYHAITEIIEHSKRLQHKAISLMFYCRNRYYLSYGNIQRLKGVAEKKSHIRCRFWNRRCNSNYSSVKINRYRRSRY
jgi:hypothetical protein